VFEVAFAPDWDHPARLIATQDKPDAAKLVARYQAYEHLATDADNKRTIDAAIQAQLGQTHQACGGSLAVDVAWAELDKAGQLAAARQAVALLEALAGACSDRDYKTAIGKLRVLRVGYRADGPLELAQKGTTIDARVSGKSFNPREVARRWLKENL
jgi:hypothetical protein